MLGVFYGEGFVLPGLGLFVVMPDDLRSGIRRDKAFESLFLRPLKCRIAGLVSTIWLPV